MTLAYQKRRFKNQRHAKLMRERPELREALYGDRRRPPQDMLDAVARETAKTKDDNNGERN